MEKKISGRIYIKLPTGKLIGINVLPAWSVSYLKQTIKEMTYIPVKQQQLKIDGVVMQD
jgi:hypothetical protein